MKVKLNPMFEEVSGQLGDLVFRELRGQTFAGRKPSVTGEPTIEQVAQRERFRQAAVYGKSALANPSIRAQYEEVAKTKNMPVFAATVADFLNAPTIENVNLAAYTGQIGSTITVLASDDFGVAGVHVSIADDVAVIENGSAVETPAGSGLWVYTATAAIAATEVSVNVVATDRPGGTAVSTANKLV